MARPRLVLGALLLATGLTGLHAKADEPDPVALMRALEAKLREARTLTFEATSAGSGAWAAKAPVVSGRVRAVRIEQPLAGASPWRFIVEGTRRDAGAPEATGFRAGFDGAVFVGVSDKDRVVVKAPAGERAQVLDAGAGGLVNWLVRADELVTAPYGNPDELAAASYLGRVLVGDTPCHAVRADYSDLYGVKELDGYWYLAVDDGLPRRVELHYYDDETGDGFSTVNLARLEVDGPVEESALAITPPDGYRVTTIEGKPAPRPRTPTPPGGAPPPGLPGSLATGSNAPEWTLRDAAGVQHRLADYKGQVVVLDFWATWCKPCTMAMPGVQKLHDDFAKRGVRVFGVNVSDEEGAGPAYMKANGFTYGLLLHGEDVARTYGVTGIPVFCIIGGDGKVLDYAVGFSPDNEERFAEVIEAELKKLGR